MNKKKVITIMMIALAVMVVGYAAFGTNLSINGTASIESNWSVVFTEITQVSKTDGVEEVSTPQASGTSATFDVDLKYPGDYIEYKIKVENKGNLNAIIQDIVASETGNEAISFEIKDIKIGDTLAKQDYTYFNIVVRYKDSITTQPDETNNKLTVSINYVQDLGQGIDSEDVIINSATLTTLSGNTTLSLANSAGRKLTNYTISGNSVQNGDPTPNTPVEVQSVGNKTINLFNWSAITYKKIKISNNGQKIEMPLATTGNGYTGTGALFRDVFPDLQAGDVVTLHFNTTSKYQKFIFIGNFGTWHSGQTQTITQEMLEGVFVLYGNNVTAGETDPVTITNFQMVKGEGVPDYEPYGKYKIPVEVSGKNYFDINNVKFAGYNSSDMNKLPKIENGIIYSGGVYASTEGASMYIETLGESEWTISFDADYASTEEVRNYRISLFNDIDANGVMVDAKRLNIVKVNDKNSITVSTAGYKYIGISSYSNNLYGLAITNLQFEKGNTQTTYEPYVESTTYNIYLDEPLRKIGDYADYIDFENGKVVRQISSEDLGSLTWVGTSYMQSNYFYNGNGVGKILLPVTNNEKALTLCSKYPVDTMSNVYSLVKNNTYGFSNGGVLRVYDEKYTDATIFKESVKGVNIYYVLNTPIKEEIELPIIRTTEGTSIISIKLDNGVSVPISVEYYKK